MYPLAPLMSSLYKYFSTPMSRVCFNFRPFNSRRINQTLQKLFDLLVFLSMHLLNYRCKEAVSIKTHLIICLIVEVVSDLLRWLPNSLPPTVAVYEEESLEHISFIVSPLTQAHSFFLPHWFTKVFGPVGSLVTLVETWDSISLLKHRIWSLNVCFTLLIIRVQHVKVMRYQARFSGVTREQQGVIVVKGNEIIWICHDDLLFVDEERG